MTEARFDLLGRTLIVPEGLGTLHSWLEAQWLFPEHAGALSSDWTFVLERSESPWDAGVLEGSRPLEGSFNPLAMRQDGDHAVWLLEPAGGVRISLEGERQVRLAWCGTLEHADALYQGLCEAMRASGLIPLHAAVAVQGGRGRAGRATAFLGPSGTGKTTTLLRAIHAGWTPVAEDFSWIDPQTLTLYSWDRALHLLPDTLERLHTLFPGVQADPFDGRKFPVPFERLFGRLWSAPLEALVVLERGEGFDSSPLRSVQLAPHLYVASGLPLISSARAPFAGAIGALLERLTGVCWCLDRDSPLEDSPA